MDNTALPALTPGTTLGIGYHDYFEDFLYNDDHVHDSSLSISVTQANGGTGTLETTAPSDNTYAGLYTLATGTGNNATGKALIDSSGATNRIKAGGGDLTIEWRVRLPTLSGTPQYNVKVGLQDGTALGDPANGIYLFYSSTVNSGQWRGVSRNASTSTNVDSSTTVVANTWYKLGIKINSAGTLVEFFVNAVSIGTSSTNIATGNGMRLMASIEKQGTSSATSRTMNVDYIYYRMER